MKQLSCLQRIDTNGKGLPSLKEVQKIYATQQPPSRPQQVSAARSRPVPETSSADVIDGAQQKILDTIAMLKTRGLTPDREMLARWHRLSKRTGLHPTGGTYGQNLASLRAQGLIVGCELTESGEKLAKEIESGFEAACATVDGGQERILRVLFESNGQSFSRETLAAALDLHPTGGTYGQNLARLRTMGLIPDRGIIKLTEAALK